MKKNRTKAIILLVVYILGPMVSFAQGGVSPEAMDFHQAGTTDMVDTFTGDFVYNIPIVNLPGPDGGYPINLGYRAGVSMNQDASWVGLGWSLGVGAIQRQMRGFPDEFDGENDRYTVNIKQKPSITMGIGAGVGLEVFGADFLKKAGQIGLAVYNNNYKGVGVRVDGDLGYNFSSLTENFPLNVGLNFSLDSQEGNSLSPSLSLPINRSTSIKVSGAYHSRAGLSSLQMGVSRSQFFSKKHFFLNKTIGFSSGLTFSRPALYPKINYPMRNWALNLKFKTGVAWWGLDTDAYLTGFYNRQSLASEHYVFKPYGYLNLQKAGDEDLDVMDFNREKDGAIFQDSPNLPIPVLTHDVFTVMGQGVAGMFRANRNDFGQVFDNQVKSSGNSQSLGLDLSAASSHFGANFGVSFSESSSGKWDGFYNSQDDKNLLSGPKFSSRLSNSSKDNVNFKFYGDHSSVTNDYVSSVHGDKAVGYEIGQDISISNPIAKTPLTYVKDNTGFSTGLPVIRRKNSKSITTIYYRDLKNTDLPFFKNVIIDEQGVYSSLSTSSLPDNHIAGFIITAENGLRYVYGLPVYQISEKDVSFKPINENIDPNTSVIEVPNLDNVDYKHVQTLSKYASSYLLTAVLGMDYVDVNTNGVDQDDTGYWVKFSYQKTENVNWRLPFTGANFNPGFLPDPNDDRAFYKYGVRENYYLRKAETKSHYVLFNTEAREDGYIAKSEKQNIFVVNGNEDLKVQKALSSIEFRSKKNNQLISTTHFSYDYGLCEEQYQSGTLKQLNSSSGKLTLRGVHISFPGSDEKYSSYAFQYNNHSSNPDTTPYDFDLDHMDTWGYYKPESNNKFFPYVNQSTDRDLLDEYAGAWNLSSIRLPSGGLMSVVYEADDYAYVHNKETNQLFELVDPNMPYDENDIGKIRFKLPNDYDESDKLNLINNIDQVYVKAKVNLALGNYDYVSGYADLDKSQGITVETVNGQKCGVLHLKTQGGYNPINVMAWQHLKLNQPQLINKALLGNVAVLGASVSANANTVSAFKNLASTITTLKGLFSGFNGRANELGWCKMVDADESWIRLNTINSKKVGGGHRVKQITISDADNESIYGQIYRYHVEGDEDVSSGVAAFEPTNGGEENPLKRANRFTEKMVLNSDNNLYAEEPFNETYFPGSSVGYSHVETMSLATAAKANQVFVGSSNFPENVDFGTSGKQTYDYYTFRDFPFFVDFTDKSSFSKGSYFFIPFIGLQHSDVHAASQGYVIIRNDMNGKMRKVATYGQNEDGSFNQEPLTYSEYKYFSKNKYYDGREVQKVVNGFSPYSSNPKMLYFDEVTPSFQIGVEREIFMDTRSYKSAAYELGANANVEIVVVFIGAFAVTTVWPNGSINTTTLNTCVVNKVIDTPGILKEVVTFKDGATSKTIPIGWDANSGNAIFNEVHERFEEKPIYTFEKPAYWEYPGMGPASDNLGMIYELFNVSNVTIENIDYNMIEANLDLGSSDAALLTPGDEVIFYQVNEGNRSAIGKGVYAGKNGSAHRYYTDVLFDDAQEQSYECFIYRSGRRNLLNATIESYEGLNASTFNGGNDAQYGSQSKLVPIPQGN